MADCLGIDNLLPAVTSNLSLVIHAPLSQARADDVISESIRAVFETVNYVILGSLVGVVGVLGNTFSLIVFFRQGLQDSVTISLFALAISDLWVDLTFLWLAVCYNPLLKYSRVNRLSINAHQYVAGWPHVFFARLTSCFTVYITLERCLCVVKPLQVKRLLTPLTTVVILLSIVCVMVLMYSLVYWGIYIDWRFDPKTNRTVLDIVFTTSRQTYDDVAYGWNTLVQSLTFTAVLVLTILLVNTLKRQSTWRASAGTGLNQGGPQKISAKDRRTIRLVIFISTLLIFTSLPGLIGMLAAIFIPDIAVGRKYHNVHFVTWSFSNLLAALNSSLNLLLYYTMSSNFRTHARALLACRSSNIK